MLLLLLSTANAGYYKENWDIVATTGDGVAVMAHVMANSNYLANYRILYGPTAERCVYEQDDHDTLYSAAANTEAIFLVTAASVMPSCWSSLSSAEKSGVYTLYRAFRGDAEADWTVEVHRVVPNLTGNSETLAQADYASLRSAAELGFASFSAQAQNLLELSPTAWSNLSEANQTAIFEAFDWIDGD